MMLPGGPAVRPLTRSRSRLPANRHHADSAIVRGCLAHFIQIQSDGINQACSLFSGGPGAMNILA